MKQIRGVLFDKDGTLFDFQATWGGWAARVIAELTGGDDALANDLARVLGFDRAQARFLPHSHVIAGTNQEVAEMIAPLLPAAGGAERLARRLAVLAAEAPLSPAVPLAPLMTRLRAAGLKLGVATNDHEQVAHAHLGADAEFFDFVAGFDSGFGAKPEPGMLLAFAQHCGLAPAEVLMVGDSTHDLQAGRAAGMATLAVLTGVALRDDLAPFADIVRPDIGHIPALLMLESVPLS